MGVVQRVTSRRQALSIVSHVNREHTAIARHLKFVNNVPQDLIVAGRTMIRLQTVVSAVAEANMLLCQDNQRVH